MKNKRWVIGAVVGFFLLAGGAALFFQNAPHGSNDISKKEGIDYWTCGMHPEVRQAGPGKCPLCQMPLVPVLKEQAPAGALGDQEGYYGCGMKQEGHCPHCDKGDKDAKCVCGGHSFIQKGEALKHCPVCKKELQKIPPEEAVQKVDPGRPEKEKPLFYRNPMDPQVTSPAPMKDEMGMDYIPVYEEQQKPGLQEEGVVSRVRLKQDQSRLAGVVVEPVEKRALVKEIRAVGRIAFDPELAIAQEEFLTAVETRQKVGQSPDPDVIARSQDLLEKSRFKLRLLGMSEQEIDALETAKTAQMSLVLPEDKAWVYADIFEYDLAWVKQGQKAEVTTTAYPGEVFEGVIKSISPVLDPKTRSVRVRLEIDNPDRKLKPEMYANVVIQSLYEGPDGARKMLAVPQEAVLDTGTRKIVYVDAGNGTFLGKEVKVGPVAAAVVDGAPRLFYPVLEGLKGDERIVTKGNFLIDSQSQLTGGMSVLWGGSQELKSEGGTAQESAPITTEHQH
ncbi:MAG: efflux RND transporter periplasmic adaptor subunit [Candidatus Omnitrophota bacterium]